MAIASAMSFTAGAGATIISGIQSTASGNTNIDVAIVIPASTTNMHVVIAVDVSTVQSMFLNTDGALTFKTNSSGSPDQTLTFAANKPLVWNTGMPVVCPLTTDITGLYLTNGTGSGVTLSGFILQDL